LSFASREEGRCGVKGEDEIASQDAFFAHFGYLLGSSPKEV
jgi:hypothetical protein